VIDSRALLFSLVSPDVVHDRDVCSLAPPTRRRSAVASG
jgi:hypothetical protein